MTYEIAITLTENAFENRQAKFDKEFCDLKQLSTSGAHFQMGKNQYLKYGARPPFLYTQGKKFPLGLLFFW